MITLLPPVDQLADVQDIAKNLMILMKDQVLRE